ncbi:MAG: nitrate/nitrite transporter NrtS [Azonexus sp.]
MEFLTTVLRTAGQQRILVAALKVALVVGTLLNIINQGGRLLDGLSPSWFHVVLNYLVPYCVSSYSAARNEMTRKRAEAD